MSKGKEKLLEEILKNSPEPELVRKAYQLANQAHQNQKRHSGEDYIIHPLQTALCLKRIKSSPTTTAAGLLHDVIDDTIITQEQLTKEFGREIAFLVEGVSKLGKIKYRGAERQAENFRKLFLAMAKDIRVILIKLCDRLQNLKTLKYLRPDKAKRIALETIEIYAPLAYRLGVGEIKGRLEDLSFPVAYPKEYQDLLLRVKDKYEERQNYLQRVVPIIKKQLRKEGIKIISTDFRAKHYFSLFQKLKRYNNDLDKIYDLVALRIIVKDVRECYRALGIIHKLWKPLPERIKDYISRPKPNGYRSLHTSVNCIDDKIIEIQIRTPQMHREAELGIAAHWYYSEQKGLTTYLKKLVIKPPEDKFYWLKQLKEWQEETKKLAPDRYLESLKLDFFKDSIFVFTPKGDIVDLPEGATPIDFAYAIHTEMGDHCRQVKVNNKLVRFNYQLQSGDVVKIITDKRKGPSRDWLNFVKTNLAKIRIKKWFNPQVEKIPEKKLVLPKILSFIPIPSRKERVIKKEKEKPTLSLDGQKGILINIAKCCLPQPGDKVFGYITKNRGVSVHKAECHNFQKIKEKWPERIVKANWT